eukprot:4152287-Amphidinium_carterae.2
MATPSLTTARGAWKKAFADNLDKLVAAERALSVLHVVPTQLLSGMGEDTLTEVMLVALVWGERTFPQDQIEEVIVCVPVAASDE